MDWTLVVIVVGLTGIFFSDPPAQEAWGRYESAEACQAARSHVPQTMTWESGEVRGTSVRFEAFCIPVTQEAAR